jgi:hypothetical protein
MSSWVEEAKEMVNQCETGDEVYQLVTNWMDAAAQNQRNTDYYRGLVIQCGETIGEEAFICDDETISLDVLCAKVPEIVKQMKAKIYELEQVIDGLTGE